MLYSMILTAVMRVRNYIKNQKEIDEKTLYLTFDDGPDPRFTPQLLDVLKANDIKATFFVVADFAENNRELIERIKREGHLIGLHSWKHDCPIMEGRKAAAEDIEKSFNIMKSLDTDIEYVRPPWGTVNSTFRNAVKEKGLKMVFWSVMAGDWQGNITSELINQRLIHRVKNGSIICLHDGRGKNDAPQKTVDAMKVMLPIWKRQGYRFAKVDELA